MIWRATTANGWRLVTVAACFIAGIATAMMLRPSCTGALALVVAGCISCVTARRWRPSAGRRHVLLVAGLVVAGGIGCLRGALAARPLAADSEQSAGSGPITLTGIVRDIPPRAGTGVTLIVDARRSVRADDSSAVSGGLLATVRSAPGIQVGDTVQVTARTLRAPGARSGWDSAAALQREGVTMIAVSPSVLRLSAAGFDPHRTLVGVRDRLANAIDDALPEPAASLLSDILFSARRPLPADLTAAMRDTGLVHIVAVSGLKVAMVVAFIAALMRRVPIAPRLRSGVAISAVAAYVALCGGGAAAIRSAVAAGIAIGLAGTGRRAQSLPLLAVVAMGMLLFDPSLVSDVGFQLSFLGTAGIILICEPIARILPGPRVLMEPMAVTVAAQIATVPVMASTFGVISLVAPLTNALVVPILAPLMVAGWVGAPAAVLSPALGAVPLQLAGYCVGAIETVARAAAIVPAASIAIGQWPRMWTFTEVLVAIAAVGVLLLRQGTEPTRAADSTNSSTRGSKEFTGSSARRWISLLTATACVGAITTFIASQRPDGRLHVAVLDVGAAAAVLVTTPDGRHALIDAGSDPSRLLSAVGTAMPPTVRQIDLLLLTGGERTAAGGTSGLPGHYSVTQVLLPTGDLGQGSRSLVTALRDHGSSVATVAPAAAWSWGAVEWRCLPAPTPDRVPGPLCALQVTDGHATALLLGTLTGAPQDELAGTTHSLQSDLLVSAPGAVPSAALLHAVSPRSIAIPTAAAARAPAGFAGLDARATHRTGVDGTLSYVSSGTGFELE